MDPVFAKLNLTSERDVLVLNAPDSFTAALDSRDGVRVRTRASGAQPVDFALVFCTTQRQVDAAADRSALD